MAECLQLTPLSTYFDITEDTFEDSGQHEPLTVRLKNILRDYKDGLTIIKELIQNADDAEATEFNICYDARKHNVNPKSLLFPDMLEAHGPALLVHNNKSFTKEDFENITKLAGATKNDKKLKIGKFGVGFCSVYHVTDTPSFVSEDQLCIFDPTLLCLRKEIRNPSRPGKKVKFTSKFIAKSKQLAPYEGIFGFKAETVYKGTLFRLPFRLHASELSSTCYTESNMQKLIEDIKQAGAKLLLFLQHVKSVTVQRIDEGDHTPHVLLTITKDTLSQSMSVQNVWIAKFNFKIDCSDQCHTEYWLVANHLSAINGKDASASVACQLKNDNSLHKYSVAKLKGEIFCYLPLSQKTGLPVHVSCNFAVNNNRTSICTSDDVALQNTDSEVGWNISLMQSVIPKAYFYLLLELHSLHLQNSLKNYSFHCLWPLKSKLQQSNPWEHMISELYEIITNSKSKILYSIFSQKWLAVHESRFLHFQNLLQHDNATSSGTEIPGFIQDILSSLKPSVIDISKEFCELLKIKSKNLFTDENFANLFFENLSKLDDKSEKRNKIIILMLEQYASQYDDGTEWSYTLEEFFTKYACIPCTPDGVKLQKCRELIDPNAQFAKLFDENESCFPIKEFADRHLVDSALHNLGFMSKNLPWHILIERAQTIASLYKKDSKKALERVKLLLDTLSKYMPKEEPPTSGTTIESIEFLPVVSKPTEPKYKLPWCGTNCTLLSGKNLLIMNTSERDNYQHAGNTIICGSQVKFVCEELPENGGCGYIKPQIRKILHIKSSPTSSQVIAHLKLLYEMCCSENMSDELQEWADFVCRQVYAFLDDKISKKSNSDGCTVSELLTFPCIWSGTSFLRIETVAKNWKLNGPYLYPVPSSLACRKRLCQNLKIKDDFSIEDIESALLQMKREFGDSPVSEQSQTLLKELIPLLLKVKTDQTTVSKIMLPDENFILCYSSELAYNDAPWAPKDTANRYIHPFVSRVLAEKFHVKPVRGKFLEKYESSDTHFIGIKYGQREELTTRISNIIRDYPFDITVLKELLQNADDAKATKMYIILDKRNHGTKTVFSEKWQLLQGPALLVWNDKTFSEKDFRGIQELGLGSKRSDAESIGQYGVGFNVVYHLTDCPSFVSGGETLCVLDPHCNFVPGADPMNPGRRYNNLRNGLWETFPDIKSAYLQSNLKQSTCDDFSNGSLFRFPLRHNSELVHLSKIIDQKKSQPLTPERMHQLLCTWAPQMKHAMFFLNHVSELKFCVIEKNSDVLDIMYHYCTAINSSDQGKREQLHQHIKKFKNPTGSKSCIVIYPLTISDIKHCGTDKQHINDEEWLIQQGVGDIDNDQQHWKYVEDNLKPRHGIAAPVFSPIYPETKEPSYKSDKQESDEKPNATGQDAKTWSTHGNASVSQKCIKQRDSDLIVSPGQVFCFLPLSGVYSKLPVYINGNFILDSSRRGIWHATNSELEDDRSKWNNAMYSAVASAYAKFLLNCRMYIVDCQKITSDSVESYYSLYPSLSFLENPWLTIAKDVYKKLYGNNSPCLVVLEPNTDTTTIIQWCRLKCAPNLSPPTYFWKSGGLHLATDILVILRKLGMKISEAPYKLKQHFDEVIGKDDNQLSETTPLSVYEYYSKNCQTILPECPCAIEEAPFHSIMNFKKFTNYLLQYDSRTGRYKFPSAPYKIPLLLKNDGNLDYFKERQKVLVSEHCKLFPKSKDKFLHHDMLDISYTEDYFMQCSDVSSENLALINDLIDILSKILPPSLKTCHFTHNHDISEDTLISLWHCFTNDSYFQSCLPDILNYWALLPATNGCLYSSRGSLLPVTYSQTQDDQCDRVVELLKSIGVPFLDTNIIPTGYTACPDVNDHERILETIWNIHQQSPLSNSVISREKVKVLVNYLQMIHFQIKYTSRQQVRSLPLFENIESHFCSIQGKDAYIWPDTLCKSGYQKWAKKCKAEFLEPHGDWTYLGSAENLGIQRITCEEVYMKYIFPNFSCMIQSERYEHLKAIRDDLFENALVSSKKSSRKRKSIEFIKMLESLCCIGDDNEKLRPVAEFYDRNEKVFLILENDFLFLPEFFTSSDCNEWLKFLKKIGLHDSPTQDEYLHICKRVEELLLHEGSKDLVQFLFSEKARGWHTDTEFLSRVSKVPFVCSKQTSELSCSWITTPTDSKLNSDMTRFCDSTIESNSLLLWTVKPIITVPQSFSVLLSNLCVTETPCVEDVVKNIKNISQTCKFTSLKLFEHYPDNLKPPEKGDSLINVMQCNFSFLEQNFEALSERDIKLLSGIPCIPVYSTPKDHHSWQVVLVRPSYVVKCDVVRYHPFLHTLPTDLYCAKKILSKLGVCDFVELKHIKGALQLAHQCFEQQEIEINTSRCVHWAISELHNKLLLNNSKHTAHFEQMSVSEVQTVLDPLYLPSEGQKLMLSSKLVYCDKSIFGRKLTMDFGEENLSMLYLPMPEYNFHETSLCQLLPPNVRPVPLSQICEANLGNECITVENCAVAVQLITTLTLPLLPKAAVSIFKHYAEHEASSTLDPQIATFLGGIEVVTVQNLQIDILHRQSKKKIGQGRVGFFFSDNECSNFSILYIDSKINSISKEFAIKEIGESLMAKAKQVLPEITQANLSAILNVLLYLLKAESSSDITSVLNQEKIAIDGFSASMDIFVRKLGKEVPQCWHHRLDQDPDNVFIPNEYVGYKMNETVILAQIIHAVVPKHVTSIDDVPRYEKRFMIFISQDDENGTEVSVLDLYKFVKGLSRVELSHQNKHSNSENDTEVDMELRTSMSSKEIDKSLNELWHLPDDDRIRAVNRLYLKWHPEKNHDNDVVAKETWKYLKAQIHAKCQSDSDRQKWEKAFHRWNYTASQHRNFFQKENCDGELEQRCYKSSHQGRLGTVAEFDDIDFELIKQPFEGRRWLRQADVDYSALCALHNKLATVPDLAGHVCFMAHQVAEKALKGGIYCLCGLDDRGLTDHNLSRHAFALQTVKPVETIGLDSLAIPLESYYLDTRYPNKCPSNSQIPAENFDLAKANEAKISAEKILEIIKLLLS